MKKKTTVKKYVDGFLLPLPKKNLRMYKKMASEGRNMWMKFGAIQYVESIGEDVKTSWALPFPKMMKLKAGEVPVFSWIMYRSKKHRDETNKKVMAYYSKKKKPKNMPFDEKRMAYGGFEIIVEN